MKKLLLGAAIGFSTIAFSQADLSATLNSPMPNDVIGPNSSFALDFTINNPGTEDIDYQDTVLFQMSLDGSPLSVNGASTFFVDSISIPAGGGSYNQTFPPLTLNIPGQAMTNMNFCITIVGRGAGWTGVTEANTTNNQACASVTYDPNTVSIAEFANEASLKREISDESYYASGTYYVRIDNAEILSTPSMVVYNIAGREVFSSGLSTNGTSITDEVSLNSLNEGIYLVEVRGLSARSVKKIVIQ